jgi:hypothetical protein
MHRRLALRNALASWLASAPDTGGFTLPERFCFGGRFGITSKLLKERKKGEKRRKKKGQVLTFDSAEKG